MRRWLLVTLLPLTALAALAVDFLQTDYDSQRVHNIRENGIWVDVVWVAEERSPQEIQAMSRELVDHGFKYAFVYVSSLDATGKPVPKDYRYAHQFVRAVRQSGVDLSLIAWVGIVNRTRGQGKVPIDRPDVRANIADFASEMVNETGFDGVQLNVEPVENGSDDFLALTRAVKAGIGGEKILAVTGHKWAPMVPKLPFLESSYWDSQYYGRVAETVDQIAVMTYDSYMPRDWAYSAFVKQQTINISKAVANRGPRLLIGVPSYFEPRGNHNPAAENVRSGLRGVLSALGNGADRQVVAGVAIYPLWEMDEAD